MEPVSTIGVGLPHSVGAPLVSGEPVIDFPRTVLKPIKRLLYRWGPRFPEDIQFAKPILRTQIMRLAAGESLEDVAPQTQLQFKAFHERGYSPLRIATICEAATQQILIEKAMAEQRREQSMPTPPNPATLTATSSSTNSRGMSTADKPPNA